MSYSIPIQANIPQELATYLSPIDDTWGIPTLNGQYKLWDALDHLTCYPTLSPETRHTFLTSISEKLSATPENGLNNTQLFLLKGRVQVLLQSASARINPPTSQQEEPAPEPPQTAPEETLHLQNKQFYLGQTPLAELLSQISSDTPSHVPLLITVIKKLTHLKFERSNTASFALQRIRDRVATIFLNEPPRESSNQLLKTALEKLHQISPDTLSDVPAFVESVCPRAADNDAIIQNLTAQIASIQAG